MGAAYRAHGKDQQYTQFSLENLKKRHHLECIGVDAKVIIEI
jgi:hypothetical protein